MHYASKILKVPKRAHGIIWVGLVLAVLTACGTVVPTSEANPADRFDYVATVAIDTSAKRSEVEAAHDATVLVFRPESGFAIVGFDAGTETLSLMSGADANLNEVSTPEVTANGWTAWSGGWTAWSGGWTAWSGGWTAWSGGSASTFGENLGFWDQIDLPEAQALNSKLGKNVMVAVIDTGIDLDHPGFLCTSVDKKGGCVSSLAPASMWADFVDGDNVPDEVPGEAYGHGTGVAGVIVQMAPNVTILPIRALGPDGSGDVAWVVQAIDHAIAQGADIINLSLGTEVPVQSLRAILQVAADEGVYVFASAGNHGQPTLTYPASLGREASNLGNHLIGVSSVNSDDRKSDFANYSVNLEMVAPGENIHTLAPDGQRGVWSGTSFSAPIAAGSMTLAISEGTVKLKPQADLGSDLPSSADDVGLQNPTLFALLGNGRLNAHQFMTTVLK